MDFSFLADDWHYLLWGTFPEGPPGGALLTLLLSAGAGLASAGLGLVFGVLLVWLQGPALAVLSVVLGFLRAIPVLMLIFWTYFLLPMLFGIEVPGVFSVMAALALVAAPTWRMGWRRAFAGCLRGSGPQPWRWASRAGVRCAMWCCRRRCA